MREEGAPPEAPTPPTPPTPTTPPTPPTPLTAEPPLAGPAMGLAVLVTGALGFLGGVVGAFFVPAGPRVGGVLLSVGVVLALVGVPALARFSAWVSGERLVGIAPVAGFLLAASLAQQLDGDQIVLPTGSAAPDYLASWVFLLGGALTGGLALAGSHRRGAGRR